MRFKNDNKLNENMVEVYQIKINQSEYEDKVVRLVKALLEIDELNNQADDALDIKEAA